MEVLCDSKCKVEKCINHEWSNFLFIV
jgi:hypothetical protein